MMTLSDNMKNLHSTSTSVKRMCKENVIKTLTFCTKKVSNEYNKFRKCELDFSPEDEDIMLLRNVGFYQSIHMVT
jgi:hypothetical protein